MLKLKRIRGLAPLLIVFGIISFIPTAYADFYKWTDKEGVVHIGTSPPENPDPSTKVKVIKKSNKSTKSALRDRQTSQGSNTSDLSHLQGFSGRASTPKVELYSASYCGYCKLARNYFVQKGVPFTEYDIENNKSALQRLRSLTSSGGIPVVVINGRVIQGYSTAAYEQALNQE